MLGGGGKTKEISMKKNSVKVLITNRIIWNFKQKNKNKKSNIKHEQPTLKLDKRQKGGGGEIQKKPVPPHRYPTTPQSETKAVLPTPEWYDARASTEYTFRTEMMSS